MRSSFSPTSRRCGGPGLKLGPKLGRVWKEARLLGRERVHRHQRRILVPRLPQHVRPVPRSAARLAAEREGEERVGGGEEVRRVGRLEVVRLRWLRGRGCGYAGGGG